MTMGRVAIVTGSRRGIGLGIARLLGSEGYTVIVNGTAPVQEASELMDELKGKGIRAAYFKGDVSKDEDRARLIESTVAGYGRIDVLVNNAGVAPLVRADILEATEESFDRVLDINLKSTFFMSQRTAKKMIELQNAGLDGYAPRIVNISSISAYASSTNRGEYCVSKAGISMVTKLFADRLAEHGIPVFEIRPGIILTDMTEKVREKYQTMIDGGLTPIKRFGTPEDVAQCVLAACSGHLDFCTGQVLNADGGFHIRRV